MTTKFQPATTLSELRLQLAAATAAAMNGVLDEKKGRMVSNLAARIIEAHQAESRSRLVSLQLKESVVPMGEAKL